MAVENSTIVPDVYSYGRDGKALYERSCSGCGQVSIVKKRYLSMRCHACVMKDKRDRLSPGSIQQDRGGTMITLYERECRGCGVKTLVAKCDKDRMCRQCALKARATHGLSSRKSPRPLYRVLKSAISRCTHPRSKDYKWYGARGISVCEEWTKDPGSFVRWALASGYGDGMELDRKDNDGNYTPENCRFISHAENCRNKSTTRMNVDLVRQLRAYAQEVGSIKLAALHFGVPLSTAGGIVRRASWAEVE